MTCGRVGGQPGWRGTVAGLHLYSRPLLLTLRTSMVAYGCTACFLSHGTLTCGPGACADMVDSCSERFLNFGLEGGRLLTLDRQQAEEHRAATLQNSWVNIIHI